MLIIVENLWAVGAPSRTPLGELTALSQAPAGGGGGLPPPQEPNPSASIFGPSGLIRQPLPTVFLSPNARGWMRTLIKNTDIDI